MRFLLILAIKYCNRVFKWNAWVTPTTDDPNPSYSLFQECWAHFLPICCHSEACTSCFLSGRFWPPCAAADKSLCVFPCRCDTLSADPPAPHPLMDTFPFPASVPPENCLLPKLSFLQPKSLRKQWLNLFYIFLQQVGGFLRSQQPEITFKSWAFKPDNSAQSAL